MARHLKSEHRTSHNSSHRKKRQTAMDSLISRLRKERKPQKQAVAIAFSKRREAMKELAKRK